MALVYPFTDFQIFESRIFYKEVKMSSEKEFIARLQQKHDTEVNWKKAVNFIPKMAEIIVYDPDETNTKSRFKIGDGETNVNELPFFTSSSENGGGGSSTVTLESLGINATAEQLNYMQGVTSNVQKQLNARIKTINGQGPDENGNIEVIGGGGNFTYIPKIQDIETSREFTITKGASAILKIIYTSTDAEGNNDGNGACQILKNGIVQQNFRIQQGKETPINVTSYLSVGDNEITIKITNKEGAFVSAVYSIRVVALSLTASFRNKIYYGNDKKVQFPYTVSGPAKAEKIFYLEMDGEEIYSQKINDADNGLEQVHIIESLSPEKEESYGAHIIKAWFTCKVEDKDVSSEVLYYTIIYAANQKATSPVVVFVETPPVEVNQYDTFIARYLAYDPNSEKCRIVLSVDKDDTVGGTLEVSRTEQTWSYQPMVYGDLSLKIESESDEEVYDTYVLKVAQETLGIGSGADNFELFLSSQGKSNSDVGKEVWSSGDIEAKLEGFNFNTNGWVLDESKKNTVLRINGSARLKIPLKLFAENLSSEGKTLEFDFKVADILDYNQTIASCYEGEKGFKITAQQVFFGGSSAKVGIRYKKDEHIRVSFVVQSDQNDRLLMCYINGILTATQQYSEDGGFTQTNPVEIEIGSSYCTIDLYSIRVYRRGLTHHQIVKNWIADTQDYQEKVKRHTRNNIYAEGDYSTIKIDQLPTDLPYLIFQCAELPEIVDDVKVKVDVSGTFVNPSDPTKSFTFTGGKVAIQGTSSAKYYRKNYKFSFKNGLTLDGGKGAHVSEYAMNDNAVPTDTFTLKADVASSEGALNVVLSMLYNDFCPYKTPPQDSSKGGNPNVRQCIEGFPCLVFWRQKAHDAQGADDSDAELQFFGKYNFNNDKGTSEVFGFRKGDESWEIRGNDNALSSWRDFSEDEKDWSTAFEPRYPEYEDNEVINYDRLKDLSQWIVSTNTDGADNGVLDPPYPYDEKTTYTNDTAEYRLAKFSKELPIYFDEQAIIFYYIFTELMLCVDQREKNAFPTFFSDKDKNGQEQGRWIVLFYDADSSCGTDNEGTLSYEYYLEDGDTFANKPVYNGYNSTLWKNLKETRSSEIAEMYRKLRGDGLDYTTVMGKFEKHQSKWPESIFNEDAYTKYITPILNGLGGANFQMIHGKKEMWLKQWLYNRFRYLDSKYSYGDASSNLAMIRTVKSGPNMPIKIASDINLYGEVKFNDERIIQRMTRNTLYDFKPEYTGSNPVIDIYSTDLITNLEGLAPMYVRTIDTQSFPRLKVLDIGAETIDGQPYSNGSLITLTLNTNTILETLNLQNCSGLGAYHSADGEILGGQQTELNLSNCIHIKNINLKGTSLESVILSRNGTIESLHLPSSIKKFNLENQPNLTNFTLPSDVSLTSLTIDNVPQIDSLSIFLKAGAGASISLKGIDWTFEDLTILDKLFSMKGKDGTGNADITGKIHFKTSLPHDLYLICKRKFPYLTITADDFTLAEALTVSGTDYKYFVTAEGKFIRFVDGGHKTLYSGQSIDECFDKINQKGVIMKYE